MASDYKLLLNSEHALEDSSPSAHTLTATGATEVSAAQKKFGTKSIKFTATADTVTIPDHADFTPDGDFTIDVWFYFASTVPTTSFFYKQSVDANNSAILSLSSGTLAFAIIESSTTEINLTGTPTITTDAWHHVAAVRGGDDWYLFFDGVQLATVNKSYVFPDLAAGITLQGTGSASQDVYFDELRLLNGRAAWVNNFTPPTRPYLEFIEEGLRERLLAKSDVFDLVGTSIYPGVAPTDAPDSYIAMRKESGVPLHVMGGTAGVVFAHVQVSSWAKNVRDVSILAKEVKGSLNGYVGVLGNNYAQHFILEDEGNEIVESETNREQRAFGIRQDYNIAHSE